MPDPTPESHPRDRLSRELRLSDATLLVVSGVIGLGVFLTPGGIADLLPHPGVILAVWIAGGLLSLAGALANAELGAMYPYAGGDYVYLREAFHPVACTIEPTRNSARASAGLPLAVDFSVTSNRPGAPAMRLVQVDL